MTQRKLFADADKEPGGYERIMRELFPYSVVHPYKDKLTRMREYLEVQIGDDSKKTFSEEEINAHRDELNKALFNSPERYLKNMNALLKKIGYRVERAAKDKSRHAYNRFRYKRIESSVNDRE